MNGNSLVVNMSRRDVDCMLSMAHLYNDEGHAYSNRMHVATLSLEVRTDYVATKLWPVYGTLPPSSLIGLAKCPKSCFFVSSCSC